MKIKMLILLSIIVIGIIPMEAIAQLAESDHPYANNFAYTWPAITEPGATQMRLHFVKIELTYNDAIKILDKDGKELVVFGGTYNNFIKEDFWTEWFTVDTMKVRLETNGAGNAYGFVLDKKETRGNPNPVPDTNPPKDTTTISITSPQARDSWQSGSTQTVIWDYTGDAGSTVNIDLYKGTTFIKQIKTNNPIGDGGRGTYTWKMDKSRPSGNDYWLKITSNLGIVGQCDYFTISGPGGPDVIIPPATPKPPSQNSVHAERTIDKTTSTAGGELSIIVTIKNDFTKRSLSLKESIPSGWGITKISDESDQFKANTNEWIWFSMASNAIKTAKYKLKIPYNTKPGTYYINGYITTNGIKTNVLGGNIIYIRKEEDDMLVYYRGLGKNPNIVETSDLLKAADDWRNNIIPSGYSVSITTEQLLLLADEWRIGIPSPKKMITPSPTTVVSCDPSYPDVCIPPYPPDLNCVDIPYKNFKVLQPDPHRFDADKDGIGCEAP